MAGLLAAAALLGAGHLALSVWCLYEVLTTDPYLVPLRSRAVWLAAVLVPLIGPATWIEAGRPRAALERVPVLDLQYDPPATRPQEGT